MFTKSHAVAGHPEHHRVAHSVEALLAVGLAALGVAVIVAVAGFLTGSWMLGAATFPALLILTLVVGVYAMGRNAKHDDPDQEIHDIE